MPDLLLMWESLDLTTTSVSIVPYITSLGIDSSLYSANPQADVVVNYTADLGAYQNEMEK